MESAQTHGKDDEQAADGLEESGETMENLLAQQAAVVQKLAERQVTWVKVIQVSAERVLVDVGEKKEGTIPAAEFVDASGAKTLPEVGQRIPVIFAGGRAEGHASLSYKKARAQLGWEAAVKAFNEKARVRGRVQSAIKGGFMVDVGGVQGFLPASLADLRPVRNPAQMVHMGVRCYIIEINAAKKQVVLSRKAVLEEEVSKKRSKVYEELKVGEVRVGRVSNVGPAGLTVDIGGLEGLVKTADVAWGDPQAAKIKRGDKTRVKVLGKDKDQVSLGIKQLTSNPADAIRKKYPPKTVVHGKILEAGPGGVRIELADKRIAVSPSSETDPQGSYPVGESISAIVQGVDPRTFAVTVSISKYAEIQDRKRMAQYLKPPKPLTLGQLLSPDQE